MQYPCGGAPRRSQKRIERIARAIPLAAVSATSGKISKEN